MRDIKEAFRNMRTNMNSYKSVASPNLELSCITVDRNALCHVDMGNSGYSYVQ